MFTITLRITRRQIAFVAAALVLACAGGLWIKSACSQVEGDLTMGPAAPKIAKTPMSTQEEQVEFLESLGWQVEEEPNQILEVLIPKEFDQVYENYNQVQKAQGCDLSKYGGKKCKRYTYVVKNYPDHPENVRANLLVYKNKLIGGDICSLELDGFLHGLVPPQ